jgi:hypothetical protein
MHTHAAAAATLNSLREIGNWLARVIPFGTIFPFDSPTNLAVHRLVFG